MIISNYLTKHTTKAQLSVLFVLLVIFVSKKFLQTLSAAAEGSYPASLIMELLWLNLPQIICFVLPFSFFLGLLFSHSHLYASHEMTAIRALGFGPSLLIKNTLKLATAHTLIYAFLWFWIVPMCNYTMDALLSNLDVHTQVSTITPGRFMQIDRNTVVYTEDIDQDGTLNHIFIAHKNPEPEQNNLIIVANQGQIDALEGLQNQNLKMKTGTQYFIPDVGLNFEKTHFKNYFMNIFNSTRSPDKALEHLSIDELRKVDTLYGLSYYHWKVVMPFMIPILALLAIPLAQIKPRQGRFAKIMPAIGLYLIYYITTVIGRRMIEQETFPETWGLWWIHLIFLLIATGQLVVHYQIIPNFSQWRQRLFNR